jgi:integrase
MAKPIKFRGKWRIRWMDEAGVRRSAVLDDYRDALFVLRRKQAEVGEIRRGLRRAEVPGSATRTFNELCDYWLVHRASRKRSRRGDESMIRRHLRPAFGALKLSEVTLERVDELEARFDDLSLSRKHVRNILTLLISMLNLAIELGWLLRRPAIRKPKVRLLEKDFRYLRTHEEIRRFLDAARDEGELVFALYAAAIYSGMREGELAGLQWDDVDFEKLLICVQRSYSGPTKSGELRWIPILDPLLPVLRAWRLRNPLHIVFPNRAGRPPREIGARLPRSPASSARPRRISAHAGAAHSRRVHPLSRHQTHIRFALAGISSSSRRS